MEFIKTYFTAEKSESLIFMAFGIITILFSAYALFKWGDSFYKGFAIPVILIGLIQMVVGSTVYFRSDKQIQEMENLFQKDTVAFAEAETPRMEAVMKNFSLYKKVEVAFVVIGLILIFSFSAKEFWLGIGVGMLLQGALMLTADIFAERRGKEYIHSIGATQNQPK
jgi:MFS family permease